MNRSPQRDEISDDNYQRQHKNQERSEPYNSGDLNANESQHGQDND
jgi:hypothetical protein